MTIVLQLPHIAHQQLCVVVKLTRHELFGERITCLPESILCPWAMCVIDMHFQMTGGKEEPLKFSQ